MKRRNARRPAGGAPEEHPEAATDQANAAHDERVRDDDGDEVGKDVAPEKEEEAEPQRQIAVRPETDAGDSRVPPQDDGLHDDECNRQYSGDEEKRRYVKRLDQIDGNTPFASRDSSGISSGRLVEGRGFL